MLVEGDESQLAQAGSDLIKMSSTSASSRPAGAVLELFVYFNSENAFCPNFSEAQRKETELKFLISSLEKHINPFFPLFFLPENISS